MGHLYHKMSLESCKRGCLDIAVLCDSGADRDEEVSSLTVVIGNDRVAT